MGKLTVKSFNQFGESVTDFPSVHDGCLTGIHLRENSGLELHFRTLANSQVILSVPSLIALKADDFRQGNIVMDVPFYGKTNCPSELLAKAYGYNEEEAVKFLPARLAELQTKDWSVVVVEESYGCSLVALSGMPLEAFAVQYLA